MFFDLACLTTCCLGLLKPKYEPFITHNSYYIQNKFILKWSKGTLNWSKVTVQIFKMFLKGSYDVAKKNIILCNVMCLRFKKHIFHILYIIVAPLWSVFMKRVDFLQNLSFWEARRALIGQLSSALWLIVVIAPLPYCDAVSRRDDTKTIKPIINKAFVASSGDIITDYNDLYCLFTHHVAYRAA